MRPEPSYPRGPLLDWSSFRIVDAPGIPSVDDLPHKIYTTSGRAAIYQALLQLRLPPGTGVLLPTYHCPTMVAPVLFAHLAPVFYGLRPDGLPDLAGIDAERNGCKAILVPHYFGFARSLAEVRRWCDERGVAMIEDCAHCLFGQAGERPVGAWGDFATASLSKFLPMSEGGVLVSAHRPLARPQLSTPRFRTQIKGFVDVLEISAHNGRLAGLNKGLTWLFNLKSSRPSAAASEALGAQPVSEAQMIVDCDMGRIADAPVLSTRLIRASLPRGNNIRRRQRNFARYARHFVSVSGARPLLMQGAASDLGFAPYVFPLWVDDPDPVYRMARAQRLPIFRWDRIWPGVPALTGDQGPLWSHHVLQLLCHQDLEESDIDEVAAALIQTMDDGLAGESMPAPVAALAQR